MTLSATNSQSQPSRSESARPVYQLFESSLFTLHAGFPVFQPVAMKASGCLLVERGAGQQVASHLLQSELVERHVGVQCFDHPLAPAPSVAASKILLIAVAVCITRQVQPLSGPLFAIVL